MIKTNRCIRLLLNLGTTMALLFACVPQAARADGAPLPPYGHEADVRMPGQKAIVVYDAQRGREDLILSVKLLGGPEAAWVVPVPSLPEVNTASAEWFSQLSDLTRPEVKIHVEIIDEADMSVGGPADEEQQGVELLSREQVGVYDVSILSSDEPGALLDWLNEHGYAFPERGEPILDAYVEEGGWYFVAARVLPGESAQLEGDVQPLWLSFDVEQPIYPMRLTALVGHAIDVLIYTLTDHRMDIEWFETEFAGELTLEPVASEGSELLDLLTGRPYYVTKLRSELFNASTIKDDLHLRRAASDEAYRKVIHHTIYDYRSSSERLTESVWDRFWDWLSGGQCYLGCCIGLLLLGLLAGLGLALRRHSRR